MNENGERHHIGTAAGRDVPRDIVAVHLFQGALVAVVEQRSSFLLDLLCLVITHAVDDVGVVKLTHDEQQQLVTGSCSIISEIGAVSGQPFLEQSCIAVLGKVQSAHYTVRIHGIVAVGARRGWDLSCNLPDDVLQALFLDLVVVLHAP